MEGPAEDVLAGVIGPKQVDRAFVDPKEVPVKGDAEPCVFIAFDKPLHIAPVFGIDRCHPAKIRLNRPSHVSAHR